MIIKRFIAAAAALTLCAGLAACGKEIKNNKNVKRTDGDRLVTADEDTTAQLDITPGDITEESGGEPAKDSTPAYEETVIKAAAVKYAEFDESYNAESGVLAGTAAVLDEREGFEGTGYVSGMTAETDWEISFDLPGEQYYNITLVVASDEPVKNGISVNGVKLSEFTTIGRGDFEACTFKNLLLEKGVNKISVIPEDGGVDIDSVQVTASEDIEKLDLTLPSPALSDKSAEYNAKALYKYLCDSFGSSVQLGQYDTIGTSYESDLVYTITGKYPAIRFGDLMQTTFGEDYADNVTAELEAARQWSENGGIVGYMWNWTSPIDKENTDSIYAEVSTFDLSRAVTKEAVASMKIEDIAQLYRDKKINAETVKLIQDIDTVSEKLKVLRDEGIAVLWRPMQEASNGYYWWGCDEESYKWAWQLMYTRMTSLHGLHNLIWVWSAQNANWYVGDEYCDILSVDVYSDSGSRDAQVNSLLYLQSISPGKPIAMSECGSFPDIQSIADEKAMWSYIGQWGGNFMVDDRGRLSEEYNTAAQLITMYNNDLTVTRDELPDFLSFAQQVKTEEEARAKEEAAKKARAAESEADSEAQAEDAAEDAAEDTQE